MTKSMVGKDSGRQCFAVLEGLPGKWETFILSGPSISLATATTSTIHGEIKGYFINEKR